MINHLANRVSVTAEEREALRAARREKPISECESQEIGRRLHRRPRPNRKVPLKILAKSLGVSRSTIRSWECGWRRPTSDQLKAWWRALA